MNFTFIRNVKDISKVNFKVFTIPVVAALKKLGVKAYTTGRNDLLIEGKKISGNAEHVHKNRVLHHGTLLFDSRLEALKGALKVDLSKFEDKAVQSNRSEVTNIANYLPTSISVEEFTRFIFSEICGTYPDFQVYEPTSEDFAAIEKLAVEKYQTWDWIFGYSPRYRFTNTIETPNGAISVSLLVEKGRITEAAFFGEIQDEIGQKLAEALVGCRHDFEDISGQLVVLSKKDPEYRNLIRNIQDRLFG